MKKIGVFVVLFLLVFSLVGLAVADDNLINETIVGDDSSTVSSQQDKSKIDGGFDCLEEQVKSDCSGADSVQEIALTILASPDDVTDDCGERLKGKMSSDGSWGNSVRDTGLAVLALEHLGEDTEKSEEWLLTKNKTATDLIWYLEQDSNDATQCKISYSGNDYTVNVADNKKIDASAGNCLSLAQSNFWLQVSPNCYSNEFQISCDKEFISTFLYRQQNSPTIYVLSDTKSSPAFGTISLKINAQCFSDSGNCDYEASAWATLALLKTGNDVENFIPYIIALGDSNKRFLPNAFVYMLTNYDDYGMQLIEEQELGNYWEADSSAYNKFYDSALALLALSSSSAEQVVKARDWLLFSQSSDGCWNSKNIRDTAIILWALEGRAGKGGGGGVTYCSDAGFFCISNQECPENEQLENYFCSGLSTVCCKNENLKSCLEYSGKICSTGKVCTGNERKASDTNYCCVGECAEPSQVSECEDMGYICRDSCSENQEEISYDCDTGICCRTKTTPEKSSWWIWLLIIGILVILGILGFLMRSRLKLMWFKLRNKFKKEKGGPAPMQGRPPGPPGFPPIRRMPMPVRRPLPRGGEDRGIDDVFKKLKEMGK